MKYLWIGLSVVSLLFVGIFVVLFTQWGNTFMKPYLESALEKKIEKKVTVQSFTLKTGFIDLEVFIGDELKAIVNGDFDLWRKNFDLSYDIDANSLDTPYININSPLHVKGTAGGNIDNFLIQGKGKAFRSDIDFSTSIKENEVANIKVDAKSLKIEDILAFLKEPLYTKGIFDLHVDTKMIEKGLYKGDADIVIHHGSLVADTLKKEFGITLSRSVNYRGTINSTINGTQLKAVSDISSNIAKLKSTNTQYDVEKKDFYSDYELDVPNLGAIGSMFDVPMQGGITLVGNVKQEADDLALDANSNFLEGKLKAILLNNTLELQGKNLDIAQLAWTFKQPKYSSGKLHVDAVFEDIAAEKPQGVVKLFTKEAKLYGKELQALTAKDFPTLVPYDLKADADLKQEGVFFDGSFESQIADLFLNDSKVDTKTSAIDGKYTLHARDLNDLYFLTQKPMRGELEAKGKYTVKDGNLTLEGRSDVLDAKTFFTFKENSLHVNSEELSLVKVSEALFYPKVFDALATLQMDYDLNTSKGALVLNALNGKMLENELTRLLLLVSKFDMTQEVFKENTLKAMIEGDDVDFSVAMNGMESYLKMPKGYIDLEEKRIKSDFSVKIEHRDFDGSIAGTLDEPKVELDSSEYLRQKLDKAIDKNVPEKLKEPAKELLKLFG